MPGCVAPAGRPVPATGEAGSDTARPHRGTVHPVPPATFKDLCLDAVDPGPVAAFWAAVLDRRVEEAGHGLVLRGPSPGHTIWVNTVPEAKSVKNRVHWDVTAPEPAALLDAGARLLRQRGDDRQWDVLADPEGNEFCVFTE